MRTDVRTATILALLLAAAGGASAQQDRQAQQQQRRFQLQLQQVQQQLQEVQAAKAKLEAENAELKKSGEARDRQAGAATAAQRQLDQRLKAVETERGALATGAAALERQLADEKQRSAEAAASKEREVAELSRRLKAGETREGEMQVRLRDQLRLVTECTDKNMRLATIGTDLLSRYRDKGLADVLRNREPVLGYADVATFNLLQELRDQVDAARFVPTAPR